MTKKEHLIQMSLLENCVREDLNVRAARAMAVINPLKVVLTNYPADQTELLPAANHPDRPELGERQLPFGRELWIEQDDFMEVAPKKFFRLQPGGEVRLRYGYIIKCVDAASRMPSGRVTEVHCTYDPETRSGLSGAERKVKGTIHWVSAAHAVRRRSGSTTGSSASRVPTAEEADFKTFLNPESLRVAAGGAPRTVAGGGGAGHRPAVRAAGLLRRRPGGPPGRASPCSTAWSRCGTPGPSSRKPERVGAPSGATRSR